MMPIFWYELRRSPLRWWLPFLLVVDAAMLFGRSTEWIGVWSQTSAAAQLPIFYIALFLAAGAAWAAGRIWHSGTAEQLLASARPGWHREAAQLAASTAYGLAPFALGIGIAAVITAKRDVPGFLWPSYLFLGLILLLVSTATGHLLGRTIRNRAVAALLAPVVVFIFVGFLPWLELSLLSGPPQFQIDPLPLVTRAALAVALALAAVLLPAVATTVGSNSGTIKKSWSAVALALAAVVAIASILTAGPLRSVRPAPSPLCSEGAPRVCIWPEHQIHLAAMERIANRLGALSGAVTVPDTFYEEGLRAPMRSNSDFALVLGEWAAARGMTSAILDETFGTRSCELPPDSQLERNLTLTIELKEWLVARAVGPKPDDVHGGFEFDEAELERVLSLPEAEQIVWASGRVQEIQETRCA